MDKEQINKKIGFFLSNRALLFATLVAITAIVIGVISLFSMSQTSQYQGLIKQVETQTETMSGK